MSRRQRRGASRATRSIGAGAALSSVRRRWPSAACIRRRRWCCRLAALAAGRRLRWRRAARAALRAGAVRVRRRRSRSASPRCSCVPLPAPLVRLLSPAAYELRSEVGARLGCMPLTLDVPATALALARGARLPRRCSLVVGGVRALAARGAPTPARRWRCSARLLAIIALVQRAGRRRRRSSASITPRSMPGVGFFGTFVDVNHAASVLALGAPDRGRAGARARTGGARVALRRLRGAVGARCVLFTASRGGAGRLRRRWLRAGVGRCSCARARSGCAACVDGAGAAGASRVGRRCGPAEGLRSRLLPSAPQTLVENQKTRGWRRRRCSMAGDYRWTGVGRGAFEAPRRPIVRTTKAVRLVYPENFARADRRREWGVPVTLLLLALVAARRCASWRRRCGEREPAVVGAAAASSRSWSTSWPTSALELPGVAFPAVVALGDRRRRASSAQAIAARRAAAALPPRVLALARRLGAGAGRRRPGPCRARSTPTDMRAARRRSAGAPSDGAAAAGGDRAPSRRRLPRAARRRGRAATARTDARCTTSIARCGCIRPTGRRTSWRRARCSPARSARAGGARVSPGARARHGRRRRRAGAACSAPTSSTPCRRRRRA